MNEYLKLLENVATRPGMFLPEETLHSYIAYIGGFDAAQNGELLTGCREWFIVKTGKGNNLVWWALVIDMIKDKSQKDQIISFFNLLKEFFQERDDIGLRKIMKNHQNWLENQSWYDKTIDDNSS